MILKDKSARECLENLKEMSDLTSGTYRKDSGNMSLSGLDMLYKKLPRITVETRNRQYVIYRTLRRPQRTIMSLTDFYAQVSTRPDGELHLSVKMKKNIVFFWAFFFTVISIFSAFLYAQSEFSGIIAATLLLTGVVMLMVERLRFRQYITGLLNEF